MVKCVSMNTMDIFFYISSVVTFAQYVDKVLRPPPAVPVRIKKKKRRLIVLFLLLVNTTVLLPVI